MIIDDEILERIEHFTKFFTNTAIVSNAKLSKEQKNIYKQQMAIEFEVIYPQTHEVIDEFVRKNKVDAYFLDVYLEKADWSLESVLYAIRVHNAKAPIFMYSTMWSMQGTLEEVTNAFRKSFPGKMVTYFYDLNYIEQLVKDFSEAVLPKQIDKMQHERKYIKDMIVKAYGITDKEPYSKNGDVAILQISDIQYGDKNMDENNRVTWSEVIRICKKLKDEDEIDGIDLLTITGDVSMHGKDNEFEIAEKDLTEHLFKNLWENEYENKAYRERILLVPGNHDYDLNFCTLDYLLSENTDGRKIDFNKAIDSLREGREKRNDYHVMGFRAYKDFAYRITGNPIYYENEHLNYIEDRFTSWNLRFICLNTCDGICADETNGVAIDSNDLTKIINDMRRFDKCFASVLSHHSPLFAEELEKKGKSEFLQDCKHLINVFSIRTWLGGHQHTQKSAITATSVEKANVYEASTISLDEEWPEDSFYEVKTTDGETLKTRRGFQIVLLKKNEDNTYSPKIFKFVFNKEGVAKRVSD